MTDDARSAADQAGAGFSPTSTPTDLLIRPLQPADQASVVALHQQMGDRETYFRFFALRPGDLAVLAADICAQDGRHLALGAFTGTRLIGVAYLVTVGPAPQRDGQSNGTESGEVAMVVAHDHQDHGVGTELLYHLAIWARESGYHELTADILAENTRMLQLVRDQGWSRWTRREGAVLHLDVDLDQAAGDPVGSRREVTSGPDVEATSRARCSEGSSTPPRCDQMTDNNEARTQRSGVFRGAAVLLTSLTALFAFAGAVGLIGGGTDFGETINSRLPLDSPVLAGVALAVFVGVPMSVAAWLLYRKSDTRAVWVSVVAGGWLIGWIIIQLLVIRTYSFMQAACVGIGVALIALGGAIRSRVTVDAPARRAEVGPVRGPLPHMNDSAQQDD
ncbi:GNAT family N-acetyltransferase [Gordonia sp. GONU]|uniref:GNAT family N-acetyltransferase n=1 Tax=Gordonia sp. GONU TaxID=2972949 RepID=UPI0021ACF175|nr:GNAT family N-acetyltransferase [Gordonia sp. GONU]MCR8897472.1 GNAT family N-acetyltransferase [Gordonia sp. GONU]